MKSGLAATKHVEGNLPFSGEFSELALLRSALKNGDLSSIRNSFSVFFENRYARDKGFSKERRIVAKKWSIFLKMPDRALEGLIVYHEKFYKDKYVEGIHPNFHKGQVTLTRSGVSANETAAIAAINILKSNPKDRQKAYILDGYYYENSRFMHSVFEDTEQFDDANMFFINHEPSLPVVEGSSQEYTLKRDSLLRDLLERARERPNQSFVLVYDKTSDPSHSPFSKDTDLPKNLRIIETASFSKHQRGGRNYFFGSVFSWLPDHESYLVGEGLIQAKGTLFTESIVHFPHKTPSEIKRQVRENRNFAQDLERFWGEHGDPNFRIQSYNYFAYLLPNLREIKNLNGLDEGDLSNTNKRMAFAKTLALSSDQLRKRLVRIFENNPGLEIGDSFGLNTARYTEIDIDFLLQDFPFLGIKGVSGSTTYRISYGDKDANKVLMEALIAEGFTD